MFFEPVLKQVEARIDARVGRIIGMAVVFLALVVAVGFATAAAQAHLEERYGARIADLILSAAYFFITLVAYSLLQAHKRRQVEIDDEGLTETQAADPVTSAMDGLIPTSVRQTLLSLAESPATRTIVLHASKNIHLLLGAGAGIYLASRLVSSLNRRESNES